MGENKNAQLTPISKARTYQEIAEFWDTHSLADYWDQARRRGLLPETLINIWLTERLQVAALAAMGYNCDK